uniref:Uncharacterized protein n=1 Tax=Biomphalaria glabrata TaxID=6526 RepID=A0A2C9L1Y3_BIOGL
MASFATTRENCIRFRVQIQPKEIVINSQQLILTMDPFWTFIYLCECPTIGHVKKNILTKLNMLTKRLKLIQPDARSIAKPRPRSKSGSKNVPETDQDQDYSNINPEIDKHFKALKNSIIFRSCQLSMEDCFLPSIEKSDLIRDGDLVSINIKTIKCVSTLNEGRFPSLISQSISKNQEFNDTLGTGEKIVEGVVKKNKIKHSKGKKLDKKCIADSQLDEDFRPMKEQKCDFADDGRCSNSILYSNSNDKTMILSNTCLSNSSNVSREEEKNETEEKKNDFCCHTSEDKNTIISYDQNSSTKKGFHNGKVENNLDTRSLSALIQNLQKQHPDDVLSTSFSTSDVPLRNSISGRRKRIRKRKSKKINSKIDENLKEIRSNFTFNQSEKNKSLNQHIKFYEYEEDMMEIASEKSIHLNTEFLPTHLLLSRPVEDKRTNNYGTESSIKENSSKFTLESLHSNTETFKSDCIQGISIDPSKKFDELLKESQSSGKKMEIIKSQTGHSVYNYHRKKKDANYLIDPSLDVISNVSAVVQ